MVSETTLTYAEQFGEAIAYELREAERRAEAGLYTEAVMRLGRATEAALYAVAREFGVNLHLQIPDLVALQQKLQGLEGKILKHPTSDEVHGLADVAHSLAKAISVLASDESARRGTEGERVRGNDSILKELIAVIENPAAQRRLGANNGLLRAIMDQRNSGAHACPRGGLRETDPAVYPQLEGQFDDFLGSLLEIALGERSRREMLKTEGAVST